MTQMLGGFQISQALYVVAKLDVATVLDDGPLSISDLADRTGARPDPLRRIIRTLASVGVFATGADGRVVTTPLGATLSAGNERSLRAAGLYWMETHYRPFGDLLHSVRTGEPAATHILGQPFFDWIVADPDRAELQSQGMASMQAGWHGNIWDGYELPPGDVVADIGGADGWLLADLLTTRTDRRGIVFDLPAIVTSAQRLLDRRGLTDRVEVVGGDFFDEALRADIYIASHVLHDWDDESCRSILGSIARACRPGAKLLVLEGVIPPDDAPHLYKMIDLIMLALVTGRERTSDEYESLLDDGGFQIERIVSTPTAISIIEATRR